VGIQYAAITNPSVANEEGYGPLDAKADLLDGGAGGAGLIGVGGYPSVITVDVPRKQSEAGGQEEHGDQPDECAPGAVAVTDG
jgi:hypothetical protein